MWIFPLHKLTLSVVCLFLEDKKELKLNYQAHCARQQAHQQPHVIAYSVHAMHKGIAPGHQSSINAVI